MKVLIKKCLVCDKKYTKAYTCSKREWKVRKFCSQKCVYVGRKHWKGIYSNISCFECRKRFRQARESNKFCSLKCSRKNTLFKCGHIPWHTGTVGAKFSRKWTEEEKEKIAERFRGPKSHFWKGGVSKENYRLRRIAKYRNWRKKVFERDNFTCQKCKKRGGKLQADHIKQFAFHPELRFELSNGRTLCVSCHKQTDTYAKNLTN